MATRMVRMVTTSLIDVRQVALRIQPAQIVKLFQPHVPTAVEDAARSAGVSSLPATCALWEACLLSVGGVSPLAPPCHLSASHTHLPSPPAPALPPPALLPRPTTPREVVYDLGKWQAGNSLGFGVHGGRAASALPMGLYAHDSLRDEA